MANSLTAAYGHGYRAAQSMRPIWRLNTPADLPSKLHKFVWRQGLRDGAGLFSWFTIFKMLGW